MSNYMAAVIGTGTDPDDPTFEGFAMAYKHADAYETIENCDLTACVDIVRENAAAFAETYSIDDGAVYESHDEMLAEVEPDIVSVCVPPAVHADIVIDCIRSGKAQAIHCEKPMAATWGECRLMAQEADRHDVQLSFNHQRRYGKPFRQAKELLDDGEIGDLERVEFAAPNLYDYGSHSFDLSNYFVDEASPEWVLAQVDYRTENRWFGAHNENQAIALWTYDNGVFGFADTGGDVGGEAVGCHNRLQGTDGVIEIRGGEGDPLWIRRAGDAKWESFACDGEPLYADVFIERAIRDAVDAIDGDHDPELGATNALNATELIFGAWESARKRGRVEFPLDIDDNPLDSMVEGGDLTPAPIED